MQFEEGRKPRARRRGGCGGLILRFFIKLALFGAAIALLCALILYAIPVSLFMVEPKADFSPTGGLPQSGINVLILGVDRLNEGAQRADTILIATVGYNKLRLTSVMRDTLVDIPGHGKQKLNAAYSYGGAQLTARALNESFGLNITKYMVVDFAALADIINAIGGVEIAITKSEQTQINQNVQDSWKVFGQMGYSRNATHALDLNFTNAGADGRVTAHLDGIQALGYARIRKIDSDFTRTHRQRTLMNAALQKFRGNFYHPLTAYRLARALVGRLETNMNAVELASIGIKAALRPEAEQLRLPIDGSYIDNGSTLTNVDFEKNREAFYEFAY